MSPAGAANGIIIYDPAESWSLATVVTMCGIHKALPMAARSGLDQYPLFQAHTQHWLGRICSLLQRFLFWPHASDNSPNDMMWETVMDVTGMWNDSYGATAWALDHLFDHCQDTEQMVAIQVTG